MGEGDEPRYAHDCDQCVWLGQWQAFDLYFCPQNGAGPTVIARYGSHGADYRSGLRLADQDLALFEARSRALERGLLTRVVRGT